MGGRVGEPGAAALTGFGCGDGASMAGNWSQVPTMLPLLAFVCALVLVDTVFFSALTPLLPHYAQTAGLTKATSRPARGLLSGRDAGRLVAGRGAGRPRRRPPGRAAWTRADERGDAG